jgi:L-malate glycosyltransferase
MDTRVAFISHSYVESAGRRKLVYLAEKTEFRLITPSWYPTPYGRCTLDFDRNPGISVSSYPICFIHSRQTPTRWILRSRDLGLPTFQPDIIHVEMEPHGWITCQALLYRRLFAPRAKVVVFSWENLTLQEQGHKARALERLARFNRQFVDFFICGNAAGKDILATKGIPLDKIAVIPQSGVDSDVFYPYCPERRLSCRRELGIENLEFAVGFVGRFVEEKGLLDLVEAVGQLAAASQRPPVLVLTGKGALQETVRSRCARLGVKLIVLPPRKYHEIIDIMNALDVLVLPSQSRPFWKEQFGRVLIEAMACGVAVIGSDSGEIPNVIGDAGLVFREGDREQLFQCLRLCCENEGFRQAAGRRGLDRVLKSFTNQRIAEQTLQIYLQVSGFENGREIARRDASIAPMPGV